ncbi:RNA polymerase sigma factor [Candidatus Gottesmanbacteria bacterium]|nr:RNA polymerase sigma factor [Candidatus Gottesmanbacteria bacterium]
MDDSVIIQKILDRDKVALAAFYQQYAPKLSRFIRGKIANERDGEEVLQDTLFAFLEAIRDFHGKAKIQTFLFSICGHKVIDYYRRKKIRSIAFSHMPGIESIIGPLLAPEDAMEKKDMKLKIRKAFFRILPLYKKVLSLKYIEELSVSDIANQLEITIKSAESKLFRARKAFVEAFISL